MKFIEYVGFKKYTKQDLLRILKWILISYAIIFLGFFLQLTVFKLTYSELIERIHTITLRGFIGYGLYALVQEIVVRGLLQQWIKSKVKSGFWSIVITTIIFCLCHLFFYWFIIFGAFIISIICGIIFDKHKDMMSCFMVHFIIGGLGKMILFL